MLQTYVSKCFQVFQAYVWKCFIYLLLYVGTVASECFQKVDQVLHIGYVWEVADGAGDVRGGVGDVWSRAVDIQGGVDPLLDTRSLPMRVLSGR
jgi:hypothetical protein